MDKRILLIYTGGTIGMVKDYRDESLKPFNFGNLLDQIPELSLIDSHIDYIGFENPIDSSDMNPKHWIALADMIEDNYKEYDGFVVLHGTDTMAYTASMLSFMIDNLEKPIVFTGSQLPIGELRTDAKQNLITSIHFASLQRDNKPVLSEVCIYFEYKLLRANRTTKMSAENFDAFFSPNFPVLGISGVHLEAREWYLLQKGDSLPLSINRKMNTDVGLLKIFPGMNRLFIENILNSSFVKVLILEAFGTGNIFTDAWFVKLLKEKVEKGLLLIISTQCVGGGVEIGRYKTSKDLLDMNAITSHDLTTEAAITKAIFLLGQGLSDSEFKIAYEKDLKGELTYLSQKI